MCLLHGCRGCHMCIFVYPSLLVSSCCPGFTTSYRLWCQHNGATVAHLPEASPPSATESSLMFRLDERHQKFPPYAIHHTSIAIKRHGSFFRRCRMREYANISSNSVPGVPFASALGTTEPAGCLLWWVARLPALHETRAHSPKQPPTVREGVHSILANI